MEHYNYERLSAQDNDFLLWESPNLPMHGAGILVFDAGPLATPEGGIAFEKILRATEAVLHRVPRYRQKLAWIPGEERAAWVDDAHFKIGYHMRHISLPRPGTEAQLKRLVALIMERPLDRARPLWETWVVEGLEGSRFALIAKTHHCMVDGSGGMGLAQELFSISPDLALREPPRFVPRPPPSALELRRDSWLRRAGAPLRLLSEARGLIREWEPAGEELRTRLRALAALARYKLEPASETPLNGPVGPHRVFDWLELPFDDLKAIRRCQDCSINDVVLAIVTGAVRDFLVRRQLRPERLEFRVSAPVNVRPKTKSEQLGNFVSSWIVRLPLERSDPLRQLQAIRDTTRELKSGHQAEGVRFVNALHEWIPIDLQKASTGAQNLLVTNVPGPPMPLYLLGAKMVSMFAQAPLIENVGLAVSAVTYAGKIGFGFNADLDRVPDLPAFVACLEASFARLMAASGARQAAALPTTSSAA